MQLSTKMFLFTSQEAVSAVSVICYHCDRNGLQNLPQNTLSMFAISGTSDRFVGVECMTYCSTCLNVHSGKNLRETDS